MEYESSSIEKEVKKSRKIVASIFYILIVVASLVTLGGGVWSLADWLIGPTGKFETFLGLNLGYQIAIIGGFLAGLFFILVFFFGLFKL